MIEGWSEQDASEVTLKGLTDMCNLLVEKRKVKDEISEKLKLVGEEISELEAKILNVMKENALPNYKGPFGTVSVKTNRTVAQPESLEKKLEFFEYLRSLGVFEEMVSVNSRTLSSWATKEIEEREKNGEFGWVPPGLNAPNEYQSLSLRKK